MKPGFLQNRDNSGGTEKMKERISFVHRKDRKMKGQKKETPYSRERKFGKNPKGVRLKDKKGDVNQEKKYTSWCRRRQPQKKMKLTCRPRIRTTRGWHSSGGGGTSENRKEEIPTVTLHNARRELPVGDQGRNTRDQNAQQKPREPKKAGVESPGESAACRTLLEKFQGMRPQRLRQKGGPGKGGTLHNTGRATKDQEKLESSIAGGWNSNHRSLSV